MMTSEEFRNACVHIKIIELLLGHSTFRLLTCGSGRGEASGVNDGLFVDAVCDSESGYESE